MTNSIARVPQVELARQQWAEGFRRLQAEAGDKRVQQGLWSQVETVTEELRRRVGAIYSLAQLADAYRGADRWAVEAISERAAGAGWQRSAAMATDAAFHLYARGARDYRP
jgi:hypothetical protein